MGTQSVKDDVIESGNKGRGSKKNILFFLGPALITSALVLGPGSLTTTSSMGALFGNDLVWVIVGTVIFMMIYTEMSTRIGLASDISFIQVIKQKWGKWGGVLIGLGAFLVTSSFQAGNSIGIGVAASNILGLSPGFWVGVFTIIGASLLFAKDFYTALEKLMIGLVAMMLISFLVTVFLAKPSIGLIAGGLIPSIPDGSMGLIIAFTATCFSIVGASYQSYLVQEKGWTKDMAKDGMKESYLGIFLLGFISLLVMLTAAAVLRPAGIQVNSIEDMGLALEPLYGSWATILFMIGLFGAAFSSLMGNSTIGGAMLSDSLGFGSKLTDVKVKVAIIAVMFFGSIIAIIFGGAPVNMIIFAQAITIIAVPFIAIALLVVANDKKIMGDLKNTLFKNIIAIAGLIVLILLAINNINNIFL
ncbi:Nramp family divalent metal transporter [Lentibacillus sp. CBA3610]|uniref:Nramp family divalent metal transporter n=1 Tax=Lentibacillus sp. CBA3610 TaxID=2518176 RepID=UPI0015960AB2|nr:Nramp family divalent metal transporter [Lentibacillus sp. CBA3610]QKY70250.1 divalent metal cation transporter [Lentibacillus sp. CBA3610]